MQFIHLNVKLFLSIPNTAYDTTFFSFRLNVQNTGVSLLLQVNMEIKKKLLH